MGPSINHCAYGVGFVESGVDRIYDLSGGGGRKKKVSEVDIDGGAIREGVWITGCPCACSLDCHCKMCSCLLKHYIAAVEVILEPAIVAGVEGRRALNVWWKVEFQV